MIKLMFHGSVHLPTVFLLLERLTLVVFLFSPCESYDKFGHSFFINKKTNWNNGKTWCFRIIPQVANFLFIEKEFAFSPFHMIIVRTLRIESHIHVLHPNLTIVDITIGIDKACFSSTNTFNLRTSEDNACRESIHKLVIEGGTLVFYVDLLLRFHCLDLLYMA